MHKLLLLDVQNPVDLDDDLILTPVPGGKLIPRVAYLAEDVLPISGRKVSIRLLDRFAARHLGGEAILHSFPHFERALQTAADRGITTAVYAPTPHPASVVSLAAEERKAHRAERDWNLAGFDRRDA